MRRALGRLEPILRDVRVRLAERRRSVSLAQLRASVRREPARRERFLAALRGPGLALIAECKRRSPSAGTLSGEHDWDARCAAYAGAGADALSILTERDHFGGDLADLSRAAAFGLPRLRKDFVLDESMVLESALFGADAALLLAVALDDAQLADLLAVAREVGLAALVEVHGEDELERALAIGPEIVGVNARDLATFEVDLGAVERLLPRIPPTLIRVAESGIRGADDLARVRAAGADAALVGEALMRARDARALLASWKERVRG